jgi:hypothetical protein
MKIVQNFGFIEFILGMILVVAVIWPLTESIMEDLLPDKPRPGDPTYIDVRNIADDELNELINKSASREDVIDRYGRPLRYREHEFSYETCEKEPVLVCDELILEFDAQDGISGFRKLPLKSQPDQNAEDINLRKLGKQGDAIAQKLWEHSETYYTSQQEDIVEERKENERKRKVKEKEIASQLKKRAESGDPEAQFELYMIQGKNQPKWLCRSADNGYTKAEMWLGYVFETGTFGFTVDNTQSYLWYRRAAIGEHQQEIEKKIKQIKKESPKLYICKGTSCDIAQKIVDLEGKLGNEGISRAEYKLDQWAPGQCEQQFVGTESINRN